MPRTQAVVLYVNRSMNKAYCQPAQGPVIPATYYSATPAPRSTVWLDQIGSGVYAVGGSAAEQRTITHDDFTVSNAPGLIGGGGSGFFPTDSGGWGYLALAPGGGAIGDNATSSNWNDDHVGALQVVAAGTIGAGVNMFKSTTCLTTPAKGALWFSTRVRPANAPGNPFLQAGMADQNTWVSPGTGNGVKFITNFGVAPNWLVQVTNGASSITVDTKVPYTATDWYVLEWVLLPGGWVYWAVQDPSFNVIVGAPITKLTLGGNAAPPTFGVNMPIEFGAESIDGAQYEMDIDWVHLETVNPVVAPTS